MVLEDWSKKRDALQSDPDHIPDLHHDLHHVDDVHYPDPQHRLQDEAGPVQKILGGQSNGDHLQDTQEWYILSEGNK